MESNDAAARAYGPDEALADVEASRVAIADRVVTPWWYHPALGIIQASLVLNIAFAKGVVSVLLTLLAVAGIGVLVRVYTSRYGLWLGPDQLGPRSRRVFRAIVAVTVAGLALGIAHTVGAAPSWVAILGAGITLVGTTVLGPRLDERWRDEVRAGFIPHTRQPRRARKDRRSR